MNNRFFCMSNIEFAQHGYIVYINNKKNIYTCIYNDKKSKYCLFTYTL